MELISVLKVLLKLILEYTINTTLNLNRSIKIQKGS